MHINYVSILATNLAMIDVSNIYVFSKIDTGISSVTNVMYFYVS